MGSVRHDIRSEGRKDGPRGKETSVPSGAFVFHDRLFQEWLMHTVPKAAPATRGGGGREGERGERRRKTLRPALKERSPAARRGGIPSRLRRGPGFVNDR